MPRQRKHAPQIRQEPLWTKILNWPYEYALDVQEDWELLDWEGIQEWISWPLGIMCNILYLLVKHARHSELAVPGKHGPSIWSTTHHQTALRPRHGGGGHGDLVYWLWWVEVTFLLLSCGNVVYLLTRRKKYQLLLAPVTSTEEERLGPNVHRRGLEEEEMTLADIAFDLFMLPVRYIFGVGRRKAEEEVLELRVWTPPVLSLRFFCLFSPVQVGILSVVDESNMFVLVPVAGMLSIQCLWMSREYRQLIEDKAILFKQMYNEYNERFVHPRLFPLKFDVACQTGSDLTPPSLFTTPRYYRDW